MRQNELHHLWGTIKPITSDPNIQQQLWYILLKIIEIEKNSDTQFPGRNNQS